MNGGMGEGSYNRHHRNAKNQRLPQALYSDKMDNIWENGFLRELKIARWYTLSFTKIIRTS